MYWTSQNRIPQSEKVDIIDRAMVQYTWYLWLLTFIAAGWLFTLIVGHTLVIAFLGIPGQQLKKLIK
jgi:hypothetical protein